jgi:hypothetical protein
MYKIAVLEIFCVIDYFNKIWIYVFLFQVIYVTCLNLIINYFV